MIRCPGFTLIELLVVVAIIVVLLALLSPAMDKAIGSAEKAICVSNQRNQVTAAQGYAAANRHLFPPWQAGGTESSAYDWRDINAYNAGAAVLPPAGMGFLPAAGFLPSGPPLGKAIHCPSLNSEAAPLPQLGMDRVTPSGIVGGSFWSDAQYVGRRMIPSYNYRAPSHESSGKGRLSLSTVGSGLVIVVDEPDLRFGATFQHVDGYNRAFGDGHAGWFPDPDRRIDAHLRVSTDSAGNVNTNGYFEGGRYFTQMCERVYGYFALSDADTALPD